MLAAPTAPSEADQVDAAGMLRVLGLLQEMFDNVVIDSPPHLSDVVLQAVAESDSVVFVVALDVPSVKNARLGLQAFDLLQFPTEKVMLVINRADSKVHLGLGDIERALEKKVDLALPSEAVVPRSVNQGVPALLEYPKSRFAAQLIQLADMVLARTGRRCAAPVASRDERRRAGGPSPARRHAARRQPRPVRPDLMASLGLAQAPNVAQLPVTPSPPPSSLTAAVAQRPVELAVERRFSGPRGPGGQGLYKRLRDEVGSCRPQGGAHGDGARPDPPPGDSRAGASLLQHRRRPEGASRTRVERIVQTAFRAEKAPMSLAETNQVAVSSWPTRYSVTGRSNGWCGTQQ